MTHFRIAIIGFGPSGIACAIQLKRMGMDPVIIEKGRPGGMLFNANLIENYPGFPGGISGEGLARLFTDQAGSFKLNVIHDEVISCDYRDGLFHLTCRENDLTCDILVMASGTSPVIPDSCPTDLVEAGLVHFDISNLLNSKDKTIGIIGAGDAAFDYALSLYASGNRVFIFNRGEEKKALKLLQDRVNAIKGISYLTNKRLQNLEKLPGRQLQAIFEDASGKSRYSMDYLIFATGRGPSKGFISPGLEGQFSDLEENKKLYRIGDIKNGPYRQVSVAVGDGVRAAMEIILNESNQQNRE